MTTEQKTIYLIGGAPTVGKTFIARQLPSQLNIPWISTDQIRGIMQKTIAKENCPNLFLDTDYEVNEYYKDFTAEEIVRNENLISAEVWQGVKALIEKSYPWESFIIEGVALLPNLIARDLKNIKNVRVAFLLDEDPVRISKVVYDRGLWDTVAKYPDKVKEKEVSYVKIFNEFIKNEVLAYGYPYAEVEKSSSDVSKVMKMLEIN